MEGAQSLCSSPTHSQGEGDPSHPWGRPGDLSVAWALSRTLGPSCWEWTLARGGRRRKEPILETGGFLGITGACLVPPFPQLYSRITIAPPPKDQMRTAGERSPAWVQGAQSSTQQPGEGPGLTALPCIPEVSPEGVPLLPALSYSGSSLSGDLMLH